QGASPADMAGRHAVPATAAGAPPVPASARPPRGPIRVIPVVDPLERDPVQMRAAPRPYRNIGIFFLLLLLLVVAGFTPRVAGTPFFGYVGTVLRGGQVPAVLHVHALVSIGWLLLLVVQAFLIRAGRHGLHR